MLYNSLPQGIFIIHENPEWIPPFKEAFERAKVPFQEIILTEGAIYLDKEPPKGVFWSRLSASCHTREHQYTKEYGRAILQWLHSYNRRVINGSSVLEFEVSKIKQYLALNAAGFLTPKTYACFGKTNLLEVAKTLQTPFISKHNQGGKGLGVRLFENFESFKEYVHSAAFEEAIDGITLLQEYIKSKEFFITRAEFIGGKFHYAVRVDTSAGSFELCPAEACNIESLPKLAGGMCEIQDSTPAIAGAMCETSGDKFSIREDINAQTPLIAKLETFVHAHKIEVAGVEFMENTQGELVVYDINTNTNYNKSVESKASHRAADRIVAFLNAEWQKNR